LKFGYEKVLNKKYNKIDFQRPRNEKKLPQIIDKEFLLNRISKIENIKHKTIISLAFSVGLRVSEVINLKINDIDSNRMIINVYQGKGSKDRIVPLSQNILELLRNYYKQYKPNEYLFNGQKSQQYSPESCNKIVKKYLGNNYHFHLLRHSCFTALLESGNDLRIIQKLAGHSSSKTTEIYTHVSTNLLSKINLPL
ncbi:MAG: tyrosine-type recombinase/integrase, partial [Bacteroidales bacterium]|nr:tyrosine-type recombinase/integrase [Bacteroidales bacterium]